MGLVPSVSLTRDAAIGLVMGMLAALSAPGSAAAPTEQDLHEQIFGRREAPLAAAVPILLSVDGEPRGELAAVMAAPGQALRVDGAALLALLRPTLGPEALRSIEAGIGPDGRIDLERLRAAGLEATYDPALVRLDLGVRPELRRSVATELRSRLPPRAAGEIPPPSRLSGYLNFRGGFDYVHQAPAAVETGRQPRRADLDAALHVAGNVLEGVLLYTQDAQPAWQRGDVRLVRDDPPKRLRSTLGDFTSAPGGFQNSRSMAGFNIARNFSLQPYRATEPIGRTSYLLKRPSRVEVFVNERLMRTLQQTPGPHEVRDLPFAAGTNDLRLRITDDVGNVEELSFPYFFDSQLLAVGEDEFSAGVGVASRTELGRRVYDEASQTFSGFHRFGVSDTLTLGSNLQADPKQHLVGVEGLWASPLGTLRLDLGASRVDTVGEGFSARLQQRYVQTRADPGRTLALLAQYTSRRFAALGDLAPDNPIARTYSGRYSQRLGSDLSVGLGASYDVARGERRDSHSESVSFSYRLGRGITASVALDRITQSSGLVERRAFVSLIAALAEVRQTLSVTRDSLSDTNAVEWSYTPIQAVGSTSASASYNRGSASDTYGASANYTGNRFTAGATHTIDDPRSSGSEGSSRSNLRMGTALVYVDGQVGVSRPVANSFALISRHPNVSGQRIGVDPIEDSYNVQSDWLGPPVLPDLQPYIRRNITIEAPELPPGYELGARVYTLEPTYKSGTRIEVGTDATVAVSGALQDAVGARVALQAGEVHSLDEPARRPVLLFTNRAGQFRADGFKPGSYELRMFFEAGARVRFAVPKDAAGVYDLGTLQLPAALPKPRGG